MLHGGTGIPADMIRKAISLGVSKINVNTECQLSFADATRKYIEAGKDLQGKGFDPRKLLAPGAEAIKATVREKIGTVRLRQQGLILIRKSKSPKVQCLRAFCCLHTSPSPGIPWYKEVFTMPTGSIQVYACRGGAGGTAGRRAGGGAG